MLTRYLSDMMVKPHQSPVFDNPENYALKYEDVAFEASDGVTIRGWLIDGGNDKIIIQSHFGVQCSRSGYCLEGKGFLKPWKSDISFLRQAKQLVNMGYSVLMYDMRNHGESDIGTTPWITWGAEEAKDIIAAVDFVESHPVYKDAEIGLLSICMGSAISTYAFGMENGLKNRKNIKAMIAVQPLQYQKFIDALGLPKFIQRPVAKLNQERTGVDMVEKSFLPNVKDIDVPTLIVQNSNDPWTDMNFVDSFYNQLTVEKDIHWADLAKNRIAAYDYIGQNPKGVYEWFDKFM